MCLYRRVWTICRIWFVAASQRLKFHHLVRELSHFVMACLVTRGYITYVLMLVLRSGQATKDADGMLLLSDCDGDPAKNIRLVPGQSTLLREREYELAFGNQAHIDLITLLETLPCREALDG